MPVVKAGGADIPEIPDGLYQATVKGVQHITLEKQDDYGKTRKVKITTAFVDSDGVSQTLDTQVNEAWGDKANLFLIASACGCQVDPDMDFDTDDMLNRKVNILVEQEAEEKPDGSIKLHWPRVKSWTRIKARAATPAAPPAAETPVSTAIIAADGTLDTNAFWTRTRRLGMTRESVVEAWGGDVEAILKAEPTDVANWLNATEATLTSV